MKNKAHSRSGCRLQRGSTLGMKALLLREMHGGMYPGEALGEGGWKQDNGCEDCEESVEGRDG